VNAAMSPVAARVQMRGEKSFGEGAMSVDPGGLVVMAGRR
jgi:hypothetical protein